MTVSTEPVPRSATSKAAATAASVLVVDDEFSVRDSLAHWFRRDGYRTKAAADAREALDLLGRESFDVALLDIKMPGMDGLELQRRLHALDPELVTVMITAYASVDTAVQALKEGAFDYIHKPIDPDELSHVVAKAVERRRLRAENLQLRQSIEQIVGIERVVGESPAMAKVLELVASVAPTDATVMIRGESGTGKELIAQAIHANSRRSYFPIVPVNCGALPESLLESELFGHEKGAFTGAQFRRKGRLELADGGTLFLDEIGTIGPKTQVDLLRVLETKEFARLGGTAPIRVDFRTISATNQDLERLVADGIFREDLYYRLNVVSIVLPPLRERRGDIPLLARHFLDKFARQMNRTFRDFEPEALDRLLDHGWPGNVRELANAVERALVVGTPPLVRAADLPFAAAAGVRSNGNGNGKGPADDSLAELERVHIRGVLDREAWNITRSARRLGIDRVTLYNKIRRYGLERPGPALVAGRAR